MSLISTLLEDLMILEITETEKLGRQLLISLDRIAPGKLRRREGGTWVARSEDDEDNLLWITGNHVLVQTVHSKPGLDFIVQVMRIIKSIDAVKDVQSQGRANDSIKGADGEHIPIRTHDIGNKRYARMDVVVHPKT